MEPMKTEEVNFETVDPDEFNTCPYCGQASRAPVKEPVICPVCGKLVTPPGEIVGHVDL